MLHRRLDDRDFLSTQDGRGKMHAINIINTLISLDIADFLCLLLPSHFIIGR